MVIDEAVADAQLYGGIVALEPGGTIARHWHGIAEWQFVLSGEGVFIDSVGQEHPISGWSSVYAPGGADGAHGFRNTGRLPLTILFVYPSPGGVRPQLNLVET
ncbi:MAG: cupin domain-containing protein [Actinomycetota bacterium]|nr:cupin domain-containing protein [Actinomycetota bacterium]MDP9335842.1 cupin domain-containing protein [Actinomycetota bacterium]